MEEEEWDLATIDELERIVQQAAAAKRASQQQHVPAMASLLSSSSSVHSSFSMHCSGTVDAWDAGAMGMELQESSDDARLRIQQNGLKLSMVPVQNASSKLGVQQQELERLSAQLMFKDQEIMDAKRACLEKDVQLKDALAAAAAMQQEIEALKRGRSNGFLGERKQDFDVLVEEQFHAAGRNGGALRNFMTFADTEKLAERNGVTRLRDQWSPPKEMNRAQSLSHPIEENKSPMQILQQGASDLVFKARILDSTGCGTPEQNQTNINLLPAHELSPCQPTASVHIELEPEKAQFQKHEAELSYKLHRIWSKNRKEADTDLLGQVFGTCWAELHTLLKFEGSEQTIGDSLEIARLTGMQNSSNITDDDHSEKLHNTLALVSNGTSASDALIYPLFNFLKSESTQIVRSALCVLRCLLQNNHACMQKVFGSPVSDMILQEGEIDIDGNGCVLYAPPVLHKSVGSSEANMRARFSSSRIICKSIGMRDRKRKSNDQRSCKPEGRAVDFLKWMLQLALNSVDPGVRFEAVSLIALFVLQTDPFVERLWVGSVLFEGGLSIFLNKEAGLDLQLRVVKIVHLLFNCSELLERVCCLSSDEINSGIEAGPGQSAVPEKIGKELLEALSICLTQNGKTVQDYILRKSALQTLAFVLATGNAGVAALVQKIGARGTAASGSVSNIAMQLVSVLDFELIVEEEKKGSSQRKDNPAEERLSLLQEALAMLSQLASHSIHSSAVIAFLTADPETARRSLNVTNRLISLGSQFCFSRSDRNLSPNDVVDMARGLRRKVLANLSTMSNA